MLMLTPAEAKHLIAIITFAEGAALAYPTGLSEAVTYLLPLRRRLLEAYQPHWAHDLAKTLEEEG